MKRISIYLHERQVNALDELAMDLGVSRSELVRNRLDRALIGQGGRLVADLAAIRDSFGALRDVDTDFLAKAPDERRHHLDRVWNIDQ